MLAAVSESPNVGRCCVREQYYRESRDLSKPDAQ